MTASFERRRSSPGCVYREKISLASRGNKVNQFQAAVECEWEFTHNASQTLRSGKNEVMRILVLREGGTRLPRTADKRTGDVTIFARAGIGLLDRTNDQGTNGGAGFPGAVAKPLIQRLRYIDRDANCHELSLPSLPLRHGHCNIAELQAAGVIALDIERPRLAFVRIEGAARYAFDLFVIDGRDAVARHR
jgi:hypothetical protein